MFIYHGSGCGERDNKPRTKRNDGQKAEHFPTKRTIYRIYSNIRFSTLFAFSIFYEVGLGVTIRADSDLTPLPQPVGAMRTFQSTSPWSQHQSEWIWISRNIVMTCHPQRQCKTLKAFQLSVISNFSSLWWCHFNIFPSCFLLFCFPSWIFSHFLSAFAKEKLLLLKTFTRRL